MPVSTDFVTGGDLFANSLNDELDAQTIFSQQNSEAILRSLRAPVTDPTTINMELPAKAARVVQYLAFNATTGNPEAGPTIADVSSLAAITADIATLADIEDGTDATDAIQTVAANNSNVTTVAGISGNVTTVAGISSDVTAVAADATDIGTVSTNITNVNTVAGISSNVTTVAGISSDVTAVAADATDIGAVAAKATEIGRLGTADAVADLAILGTTDAVSDMNTLAAISTDIDTVAGISSNVTTVAGISSAVSSVAADATDIGTVSTNIANVNTVAGISANVTTVAGISADVTAVAGISGDIQDVQDKLAEVQTVADDLQEAVSEIETVGANIADVNTVAGISSDVTTAAGNSANITTVAGISGNVTTVAGISANVTAVAGDAADIGTVATDLAGSDNIGTVAGSISNVNAVGGAIADVSTVATNLSDVQSFANTYRIGATDPTVSLDEGDLFFNTTDNAMKYYDGASWASITAGLTDIVGDATPQLGGNLDLNSNDITGTGNINVTGTVTADGASIDGAVVINESGADVDFRVESDTNHHAFFLEGSSGINSGYWAFFSTSQFSTLGNRKVIQINQTSDTVDGGLAIVNSAVSRSARLYVDNSNVIHLAGGETDVLNIDNSGRLLVGTSTAFSNFSYETASNLSPQIQFVGSTASTAHLGIVRTTGQGPSDLTLGWGSNGNVAASNQDIGALLFSAFDGSVYRNAAYIQCEADGAHAAGDTPGRLVFSTTADGASSPTERMRIDSSGNVGIGTSSPSSVLNTFGDGVDNYLNVDSNHDWCGIQFQDTGTTKAALYMHHANSYLRVDTNGSERMRIDSSGNVGIGTTTPGTTRLMSVADGDYSAAIQATSNDSATNWARLDIKNQNATNPIIIYQDQNGQGFIRNDSAAQPLVIMTGGGNERMRINSSGSLLLNQTTGIGANGGRMEIFSADNYNGAPNLALNVGANNTGGIYLYFTNAAGAKIGSVTQASSTSVAYNTTSDYRLKENIQPMNGALERVQSLKPVTFRWKDDGSESEGFIAHELQTVIPKAVVGEKDAVDSKGNPDYQGIDQSKLVPLLTAALQEAIAKIESLETRIATLEGA